MILYTFSFSTELVVAGMDAFDISNKVMIKKQCKNKKSVSTESQQLSTTISTDKSELASLQVINAICMTTTAPHFASLSYEQIPYFDTLNSFEIAKAYNSPSLLRDPFPPKA